MQYHTIPLHLKLVHDMLKLVNKSKNNSSIVFEWNDDHGKNIPTNLPTLLLLKRLDNVGVVALGLQVIAHDAVAQRPQIPKVKVIEPFLFLEDDIIPHTIQPILLHLLVQQLNRHI